MEKLSGKQERTAKRVAIYYRKSGSDYQFVERKVRANWLPDMAEYILHLYYNMV